MWAVAWMGYVNTINEWTGSGNLHLQDKMMMVYWESLQTFVLCNSWNMNRMVVRFDVCMAVCTRIMICDVTSRTLVGQY
jgi:hypothetical protein